MTHTQRVIRMPLTPALILALIEQAEAVIAATERCNADLLKLGRIQKKNGDEYRRAKSAVRHAVSIITMDYSEEPRP